MSRSTKWNKENKDRRKVIRKASYDRNIDKIRERRANKSPEQLEGARAAGLKWSRNNKEQAAAIRRKWLIDNPHKSREMAARRRARIAGQLGNMPDNAFKTILDRYPICLFPGCEEADNLHIDHVIPIALGGMHDINNLQVLCRHHNTSKGAKVADYR
jgi:5-methylcytosine-specific restriction endonuclease McrA